MTDTRDHQRACERRIAELRALLSDAAALLVDPGNGDRQDVLARIYAVEDAEAWRCPLRDEEAS